MGIVSEIPLQFLLTISWFRNIFYRKLIYLLLPNSSRDENGTSEENTVDSKVQKKIIEYMQLKSAKL